MIPHLRLGALLCLAATASLAACGPHPHIPPRPLATQPFDAPSDSDASLARALAPVLYRQPDEWFRLVRVAAIVHPNRRIVGYHLLWQDDAHGAWIPLTIPTDEEIVWVGYDDAGQPTDLWTYWHGVILHTPWRGRGRPAVDVQWGKHGSLPRGTDLDDLPFPRTLPLFYAFSWVLPDLWLGAFERPGPLCFCHGYARYRTFTDPLPTADRLDLIARTAHPDSALRAVFGESYSRKPAWP